MDEKKLHRIVYTAAAIIWLFLIWGQSLMPASVSSQESMACLNMLPEFIRGVSEYMIRKSAHLLEYLLLGILAKKTMQCWNLTDSIYLFTGMSAALSDETIQLFIEGRSSQVSDVWIDFCGFCIGGMLLRAFNHLKKSINEEKL